MSLANRLRRGVAPIWLASITLFAASMWEHEPASPVDPASSPPAIVASDTSGSTRARQYSAFDSTRWKAQRGSEARANPRLTMLEPPIRMNMSRAAVRALLGEPDRMQSNRDVYILGAAALSIDCSSYVVEYDDNGRVRATRVLQG